MSAPSLPSSNGRVKSPIMDNADELTVAPPGAWTRLYDTLPSHPKTKRLARRLGLPIPHTVGHLCCLWAWAMRYAEDGNLSECEPDDVADAAMYEGDAERFVEALVSAGFLDRDGPCLFIHNWARYGGQYFVRKEQNRRANQAFRDRKRAEQDAEESERKQDEDFADYVLSHPEARGSGLDAMGVNWDDRESVVAYARRKREQG